MEGSTIPTGFYHDHILPHLVNLAMRNRLLQAYRERIVRHAEGRVLEIGIGSGMNLPFYTDRATVILGLDPHPKLLEMASQKSHCDRTRLINGSAESIPLESASIDTVVTTWTLCSVPDIARALSEMRRVLSPGGQLLLVEHGLAPDENVRKWQHRLTPLWKRLAGGCHLDRPILGLVESAGFRMKRLETGYMRGPKPMTFMYEGVASPSQVFAARNECLTERAESALSFFGSFNSFLRSYATLVFSDKAKLDEGHMWPTAFALKELTAAEEAKIGALVKKAAS